MNTPNPSSLLQEADKDQEIAVLKEANRLLHVENERLRNEVNENLKIIISDERIDEAWGSANFGSLSKREVIRNALLKCACGYRTGKTAEHILRDLGLIYLSQWRLSKAGQRYLFEAYAYGNSI